MKPLSLAGQTCILTGAPGGVGNAIARRFAAEGARLVLLGRNIERLSSLLDDLNQKHHPPLPATEPYHRAVSIDVTQAQDWDVLAQTIPTKPGPATLINCAGISQTSLLAKTSHCDVDNILRANLSSAILGSKYISARMIKSQLWLRRGGEEKRQPQHQAGASPCIINVASLLATRGKTGTSVYSASKAGLLGLTSSLAVELGGYGIRVNAIVPGYIDTFMTARKSNSPRPVCPVT